MTYEELLELEIQYIRERLYAVSNDILAICNGEEPEHITMEDAEILREIADGFSADPDNNEGPVLTVVPKKDGH